MHLFFENIGTKSFVRSAGEDAVFVTWTKKLDGDGNVVTDSYNNVVWEDNRKTIKVIQSYQTSTKVPVKMNSELGQYRGFDYEFFTVDLDVDEVTVGVSEKPPELIYKGRRHRITEHESAPLGVIRIVGEQIRTGNVE